MSGVHAESSPASQGAPRRQASSEGKLKTARLLRLHALAFALVSIPFLAVEIPALVDYPNHLARMRVLADLAESPALRELYRVDWAPMSNLAMDLFVPVLAPLLGLEASGKLFVVASLALIVAGTLLTQFALHRSLTAAGLLIHFVLFNYVLAFGFLNYLFSVGLMLVCTGLWLMAEEIALWKRLLMTAFFGFVLFFGHILAFFAFGLFVAGHSSYRQWTRDATWASRFRGLIVQGLPLLSPLVLQVTLSPAHGGDLDIRYQIWIKITAFLTPTLLYHQLSDMAVFLPLALFLYVGFKRHWLTLPRSMRLPLMLFVASILLIPSWMMDNWGNDWRLSIPLAALFVAALRADGLPSRLAPAFLLAGLALLILRVGSLTSDWREYDARYAEFREAARILPAGARILPAYDPNGDAGRVSPAHSRALFFHVPTLALLERPVFVPTLFTAKGKQVLSVRPPNDLRDVPHSKPMTPATMAFARLPDSRRELLRKRHPSEHFHRFAGWPEHFDYVVMLDFGNPLDLLPEILTPVWRGSYFTIYRIEESGRRRRARG